MNKAPNPLICHNQVAWKYDNKYWNRSLVGISMEQINVNSLSSKKRIANQYDSVALYGICQKSRTHEMSLDQSLHRKKRRKEYWENIAKIAKELDLQNTDPDHSKSLKLKKNKVILINEFSTKLWTNTLRNFKRNRYRKDVEELPNYPETDDTK